MNKKKILVIVVTLLIIQCLTRGVKALFIPSGSYSYVTKSGETINDTVLIKSNKTSNVTIIPVTGVSVWISVSDPIFELEGTNSTNDSKEVTFYIQVPDNQPEGVYSTKLRFSEEASGVVETYEKQLTINVSYLTYEIYNDRITKDTILRIDDYNITVNDILFDNRANLTINKSGSPIHTGLFSPSGKTIDNKLKIYVNDTMASAIDSTKTSANIRILSDNNYSVYKIILGEEISEETDFITIDRANGNNVIAGQNYVIKTIDENNYLKKGTLNIELYGTNDSQVITTTGLAVIKVPKDESGPIIIYFYDDNGKLLEQKAYYVQGYEPSESNNTDEEVIENKPKIMKVFAPYEIETKEKIVINVIDNSSGDEISTANVEIDDKCSSNFNKDVNDYGVVTFDFPYNGWCEGEVYYTIRDPNYETIRGTIKTYRERAETSIIPVDNKGRITRFYLGIPTTILIKPLNNSLTNISTNYNGKVEVFNEEGLRLYRTDAINGRANITLPADYNVSEIIINVSRNDYFEAGSHYFNTYRVSETKNDFLFSAILVLGIVGFIFVVYVLYKRRENLMKRPIISLDSPPPGDKVEEG